MEFPFQIFWQAIINGFAIGWIYILMALGLTLILSIMGILQLAHGEIFMMGGYIVYYLSVMNGLNFPIAIILSMICMAVVGIIIEKLLFAPVQNSMSAPMVISVGIMLILQNFAVVGFGLNEKGLPSLAEGSFNIFGSLVPKDRIIAVFFGIGALFILYLFLMKTKQGMAMVASAQNPQGALLRGINPKAMSAISMAIGCAFAAFAGALTGSIFTLSPFMGTQPILNGLVIIVLGGMGSITGTVLAGLFLGLVNSIFPVFFNAAIASVIPLLTVILLLLVKPGGIFGYSTD